MLLNSVNTNVGAMIALQNLNATQSDLQMTQNRLNTGKKVSGARDNGAIWAIAQRQSTDATSLDNVMESMSRNQSAVDLAISSGQNIVDALGQMKQKALAAQDAGLSAASKSALNNDFQSLVAQISTFVTNANFNGTNFLSGTVNGAAATSVNILTSVGDASASANTFAVTITMIDATSLSINGQDLTAAGGAGSAAVKVDAAIDAVSTYLGKLGTASKTLEKLKTFMGKVQDSMNAGVGSLVDADLAKESARLQSLQTKQQLGVQALSIANQSPNVITSLFKG